MSQLESAIVFKTFHYSMRFDSKLQKSFVLFILSIFLVWLFLFTLLDWFSFVRIKVVPIRNFETLDYSQDIYDRKCNNDLLRNFYKKFGRRDEKTEKVVLTTRRYAPGLCVFDNLWEPLPEHWQNKKPEEIPIGMAIHSTPDLLHILEDQLKTWDGLISLALIIPFDEKPDQKEDHKFAIQHIMETLERLKTIKQMNKRVWLQVLFYSPLNECPRLEYSKPITGFADDLEYADWMLNDMKRLCASQKIYPINVVRNVARLGEFIEMLNFKNATIAGLQTPLFVSTDIENLFSEGYAHRAQKLANQLLLKENKNTVLVHRRFESDWSEPTPRLVKNLKALIERKKAFVFHQLVFPVGHAIPHLNEWLKWEDDGKRDIDIQKELTYFRHQWEPQYVSRNDKTFPLHDEGFLHRNRDNTAMGHEICRANITFSIMNGLFSVHRGVKRKELARFKKIVADFTRKELPRVVRRFRKRMDMLYGENKGKCPVFAPDIRYDKSKELKG